MKRLEITRQQSWLLKLIKHLADLLCTFPNCFLHRHTNVNTTTISTSSMQSHPFVYASASKHSLCLNFSFLTVSLQSVKSENKDRRQNLCAAAWHTHVHTHVHRGKRVIQEGSIFLRKENSDTVGYSRHCLNPWPDRVSSTTNLVVVMAALSTHPMKAGLCKWIKVADRH